MENAMLIVDDSKLNREILNDLFQNHFEILKVENGEQALAMLEEYKESISIVILDLVMPGLSGFDILKKRSEIPYFLNIPVIVITGSGEKSDQLRAFELGANDYIAKPFEAEIVMSRVNSVVTSHRRILSIAKEAEKLKEKSELDQMTGLLNKTTTENVIKRILRESTDQLNVLFVFDIDNFKAVNDLLGHQTGDHVIRIVADVISGLFRKTDIVGRIGGDEFVAMMVDIPSLDIAYKKVNLLIDRMKHKTNLSIPQNISLSVGMAASDEESMTYAELFHRADNALFEAKESGKACYRMYGAEEIHVEEDKRPIALLLSQNRNNCSTIHAVMPDTIRIMEVSDLDHIALISESDFQKVKVIYLDLSNQDTDGEETWRRIHAFSQLECEKIIAICQEGNLPQYALAIQNRIADMLAAPLDTAAFKRRSKLILQSEIEEM